MTAHRSSISTVRRSFGIGSHESRKCTRAETCCGHCCHAWTQFTMLLVASAVSAPWRGTRTTHTPEQVYRSSLFVSLLSSTLSSWKGGGDIAGRVTPRPLPNSSLVCLLLESFVDFAFPMASIEAMLRQRGAPSASDIDRGASNVHWNRSQVWACLDIFMRLSKALTRPSYRGSGLSYTPILPLYLTREFISQSGSLVTRTTDRREVIIPASWKLGTISWRSLQRFQCKFTVGLPLPIPLLV